MRRYSVFMFGVVSLLSLLSGCSVRSSMVQSEVTESISDSSVTMTNEQEELLRKISFNEEGISENVLAEWEKEVLSQYEFAMDYLHEKYPSHSFRIIDGDPKNKLNSYSTYWFVADGDEEPIYTLYLYVEDSYRCEDDFYSSMLEPDYEEVLLDLLKEDIPSCIGVNSTMGTLQGEGIGEDTDASSLLGGSIQVQNNTVIFVDGTNADDDMVYEQIKSKIAQEEVYGSYIVIVLTSVPEEYNNGDDLWKFVKEHGDGVYSLRESFNQWNDGY